MTRGAQPLHHRPDAREHRGRAVAAVVDAPLAGRGRRPPSTPPGTCGTRTCTELNNPLPRWWLWLFIITVVFGLAVPRAVSGARQLPGHAQLDLAAPSTRRSRAANAARIEQTLAPYATRSVAELAHRRRGAQRRPQPVPQQLRRLPWLRRRRRARLSQSHRQGLAVGRRSGHGGRDHLQRPHRRDAAVGRGARRARRRGRAGLRAQPVGPQARGGRRAGRRRRNSPSCASACHGADAHGNPALGAPNLTDGIWLHGGSLATMRETIEKGRTGTMPAHAARLGETRVKLLAAYVLSLGAGRRPQARCR